MPLVLLWPAVAALAGFAGGFLTAGGLVTVARLALLAAAVLLYMRYA